MKQFGIFLTLPFVLAIPPVIGLLIGRLIDGSLGTTFFLYFFMALGFIAGFREFYRIIRRFGDEP